MIGLETHQMSNSPTQVTKLVAKAMPMIPQIGAEPEVGEQVDSELHYCGLIEKATSAFQDQKPDEHLSTEVSREAHM